MPSPWTVRSALHRAVEVLRDEGPQVLWFKVLGETVYRRLTLVELPLASPPPLREPEIALTYGFVEAGPDTLPALEGANLTPAEIERRLVRGDRCFVARHDGRIVSARWLAARRAWIEYLGRDLDLLPGETYLYETYTAPGYRGLSISGAAGTRLAQLLASEGLLRIVGGIVPENRPALRTAAKTGYREAGRTGYVRFGPWRHDFTRRRP